MIRFQSIVFEDLQAAMVVLIALLAPMASAQVISTQDVGTFQDRSVVDAAEEPLGKIQGLVLDMNSGNWTHLLIKDDKPLGGKRLIGATDLSLPIGEREAIEATVSQESFEKRPKFIETEGIEQNLMELARTTNESARRQADSPVVDEASRNLSGNYAFASEVVGRGLRTAEGETVGIVSGLWARKESRQVYVLLEERNEPFVVDSTRRYLVALKRLTLLEDSLQSGLASEDFSRAEAWPPSGSQGEGDGDMIYWTESGGQAE